ncbi:MAG: glycoside hydrolase family 13 protein [Muribaculaceae bacterium]|nr:glycoside hydrolase family 13 protein [Muribaculaceae bacterium]MBQ7205954.1 glycoside hydrolase family 13 protein [Muribaculaceae bacterium]
MKKIVLILAAVLGVLAAQAAKVNVDRIEPTDWYVGINAIPSVQLMVYGEGIGTAEVSTLYPGVTIDSVVRVDSPNYLLVYMDTRSAQPGTMELKFQQGRSKKTVKYQLKAREKRGSERMGFTNADVLYMLMPDRFADGNPANNQIAGMEAYKNDRTKPSLRHGGDIEGIRQHLDYFTQLGVTALWFTPVLENNSPDSPNGFSTYHGYATTNYYRVDPRFGTNEEYRQLCDEAHSRGLKVVMDMIFNHCGSSHPWLEDMPTKDWFNQPDYKNNYLQTSYKLTPVMDPYASEIDLKETVEGWFVRTMPDLNHHNVHVMNYLIQNSVWWIETVGIDGIRMDTYPYAYADAMARWMKVLDTEYPNFNVVGETWVENPAYTAAWQKGNKMGKPESYLPTVMDFSFYEKIDSAKHEETDGWWRGYNRVYNSLCHDYLYPNPSSVMAFIENHDTDRFLRNGQDVAALKQALALLLTIKRIPQLYYGTEILMNGTKEVTDGNVRKDFPGGFPGDARNAFTAEGRTPEQNDMFNWLSALLHWRNGNETIIRGYQTQFIPWKGVYVVTRRWHRNTVMTIINGTTKPATLEVDRYAELFEGDNRMATDVITGEQYDLSSNVPLPPRAALVLEF